MIGAMLEPLIDSFLVSARFSSACLREVARTCGSSSLCSFVYSQIYLYTIVFGRIISILIILPNTTKIQKNQSRLTLQG